MALLFRIHNHKSQICYHNNVTSTICQKTCVRGNQTKRSQLKDLLRDHGVFYIDASTNILDLIATNICHAGRSECLLSLCTGTL